MKQSKYKQMPVKVFTPPPPNNSKQLGVLPSTLLYNGSKFEGSQKSKGNKYAVEVVLQVITGNKLGNKKFVQ